MSSEGTTPDPDAAEEEESTGSAGGSGGSGGSGVSTNPNEAAGEHESMAIADSESQQDPGEQAGGGQHGG